jgi:hypothetical protein
MNTRLSRNAGGILAVSFLMLAPLPVIAGEGFGSLLFGKKVATLNRVNPPKVLLLGTRIDIKTNSHDSQSAGVAQRLHSQLESDLLRNDSRLSSDPSNPQTLIEVTITQNSYNESWENRQMTQSRQVGKDSKGHAVYQDYQVDVKFKTVKHHFSAAYKVTDQAKHTNLDSDSVQSNSENSYQEGNGAPDQASLENTAIQTVVNRIVHDLTPTREPVGVLLPKGSLENYANLAEANLWNKYLEALEGLAAKPKPEDESYRKYALGVAYEALGYSAENEETTLKYLEQASDYYNQALEANPKEKYFAQAYESFMGGKKAAAPLERVRSALVSYRKLKENRERYAADQATVTAVASAAAEPADGQGAKSLTSSESRAMNNSAVIKMVRAGLSEDIVLTSINSAAKTSFDVSPDGLVALSEAKVSPRVILRIQEVAKGKTPGKKAGKAAKPKGSASPN